MEIRKSIIYIILTAAIILIAAGCDRSTTEIRKLLKSPEKYMDQTIQVAGEVTKSYSADLIIVDYGIYQVDDGTGRIWVLSRTGVPKEGSRVGVKGNMGSGFKIGREVLGVIIREEERRAR